MEHIEIRMNLIMSVIFHASIVNCIWPPPYNISLTHDEEFVIGEYVANNENEEFNMEDEMIQNHEIVQFHLEKLKTKFDRLHEQVKRYNDRQKASKDGQNRNVTLEEKQAYFEVLDPEPWEAGFVDNKNNYIKNQENKNVYYLNEMTKQLVAQKIEEKRSDRLDNEYNYEELDKEYNMEVLKEEKLSNTFNSTNSKDGESVKEALDKMVHFKTEPRNCTKEELSGIGFAAVKCVWIESKVAETKESKRALLHHVTRISLIWLFIYLVIAIPCFLQQGWCCCCLQCKYCKPRKRIDLAKKYLLDNPPGKLIQKDGKILEYNATEYEKEAYEKLKKTIMNL